MRKKPREITPDTRLLTYDHIAVMLSVSIAKVFAMRESGRLPVKAIKIGGSVRFHRTDVEGWIAAGCPTDWKGGAR